MLQQMPIRRELRILFGMHKSRRNAKMLVFIMIYDLGNKNVTLCKPIIIKREDSREL